MRVRMHHARVSRCRITVHSISFISPSFRSPLLQNNLAELYAMVRVAELTPCALFSPPTHTHTHTHVYMPIY